VADGRISQDSTAVHYSSGSRSIISKHNALHFRDRSVYTRAIAARMCICFLDCFRRLRILTIHQFPSPELVRPILNLVGRRRGVVEAFDWVFGLWFGPSVQVLFIHLSPVLLLLYYLLAVEEHASKHYASRCATSLPARHEWPTNRARLAAENSPARVRAR
jgi:hypothetical protein